MRSALAFVLIGLGFVTRFLPHPENAVGVGALALYAGARLPKSWGFIVPVAALLLSDAVMVMGTAYADTLFSASSVLRYLIVAGLALATIFGPQNVSIIGRILQGACASLIFFAVSNFGVWIFPYGVQGEPGVYPLTVAGLADCYAQALPFFRNSFVAEILSVGVLFGLDALTRELGTLIKSKTCTIGS
jgi:hypothetical protein